MKQNWALTFTFVAWKNFPGKSPVDECYTYKMVSQDAGL